MRAATDVAPLSSQHANSPVAAVLADKRIIPQTVSGGKRFGVAGPSRLTPGRPVMPPCQPRRPDFEWVAGGGGPPGRLPGVTLGGGHMGGAYVLGLAEEGFPDAMAFSRPHGATLRDWGRTGPSARRGRRNRRWNTVGR